MSEDIQYYTWRPEFQRIYQAMFHWFDERWGANLGYREVIGEHWDHKAVWAVVQSDSERDVAFTFFALFPTHFFKTYHSVYDVIGLERLADWLRHVPRICVMDVGCGTGAASAAFAEAMVEADNRGLIERPIEVYCIGVDPNTRALSVYDWLMRCLSTSLVTTHPRIRLTHRVSPEPIPSAFLPQAALAERLQENHGNQPAIPHMIVFQSNLLSAIRRRSSRIDEMINLGIDSSSLIGDDHVGFGVAETRAYREIFETCKVDLMHIITIETDQPELQVSVEQLAAEIGTQFSSRGHQVTEIMHGRTAVSFENPVGSYWRDTHAQRRRAKNTPTEFVLDIKEISSASCVADEDWHRVISKSNLEEAWAKARNHLRRESLVDEIELRLFERHLDRNLDRLRIQLARYVEDVIPTCTEDIFYGLPKGPTSTRPKALSRLEEETISMAIIQQLGIPFSKNQHRSFAYRLSRGTSEFPFEYWYSAYRSFIDTVRRLARSLPNATIINVDIKAYYTRIVQLQLLEAAREMSESRRIQWLLRLLLVRPLDDEHEEGLGLSQGDIGSGFFSNLYLAPIDSRFGDENEWGLEFFRYADDMYLIVPEDIEHEEVLNALVDELDKLGLEINEGKTQIYTDIDHFLAATEEDEELSRLFDEYAGLRDLFWVLDADLRTVFEYRFRSDDAWWDYVDRFNQCLRGIGVYVSSSDLSRQVRRYLLNRRRRQSILSEHDELTFGLLPQDNTDVWVAGFLENNSTWVRRKQVLVQALVGLFRQNLRRRAELDDDDIVGRQIAEWRIRFAVNRLLEFGLADIVEDLVSVIRDTPWLLRNLIHVAQAIADQGHSEAILQLLSDYSERSDDASEYVRAVLIRAIRYSTLWTSDYDSLVIRYALNGSIPERLMASETWIYRAPEIECREEHVEQLRNELWSNTSLPNRVKKNYWLILSEIDDESTMNGSLVCNGTFDYILQDTHSVMNDDALQELVLAHEPGQLRLEYYSGYREESGLGDMEHSL